MPELPEVHTTVTELHKLITGKKISAIWSDYTSPRYTGSQQIKDASYVRQFSKAVVGATITGTSRLGKNVLIHLNTAQTILIHMKMTGHLLYGVYAYSKTKKEWFAQTPGPLRDDPWNAFIHLVFTFSDGTHLALSDLRKFAKVTLIKTNELHSYPDLQLGPDPLSPACTRAVFIKQLQKNPDHKIKQALMDQKRIAGVGNIYSDEALWLSKIAPTRYTSSITPAEYASLYTATKKVLAKGIDFKGDSTSDYRTPQGTPGAFQHAHNVYRRTGKPCNRRACSGTITRTVIGGRGTHYCNVCQK